MILLLLGCDDGALTKLSQSDPSHDSASPTDSGDSAGDTAEDSGRDSATGDSGAGESGGGTGGESGGCVPHGCADVGAECGTVDDGCGTSIECGSCDAWYGCGSGGVPNVCSPMSCIPHEEATTDGGGKCDDLAQAWTARGVNVGYFPFETTAEVEQYSGDYSGSPGVTFTRGASTAGVLLQTIPAGTRIGLSSSGPWYDPASECFPSGTCGADGVDACTSSAPPLRPGVGGWYWGYAESPGSHMQGWIWMDAAKLRWLGDDPSHTCVTGPAGLDYEVSEACGRATSCSGTNRTCGDANPCTEGADDCGSTSCGASSGGALTPSAHRMTATLPTEAVPCTEASPPDSRVLCLPNGDDVDFFYVYPFGAYVYWAQNSTTKFWLHYGDGVQVYYHTRDSQGVLWDFVEVLSSGAPGLTPASEGAGGGGDCSSSNPDGCTPCRNGGSCGWIQDVFLR